MKDKYDMHTTSLYYIHLYGYDPHNIYLHDVDVIKEPLLEYDKPYVIWVLLVINKMQLKWSKTSFISVSICVITGIYYTHTYIHRYRIMYTEEKNICLLKHSHKFICLKLQIVYHNSSSNFLVKTTTREVLGSYMNTESKEYWTYTRTKSQRHSFRKFCFLEFNSHIKYAPKHTILGTKVITQCCVSTVDTY